MRLNTGVSMPCLGFGVFRVPDDETGEPFSPRSRPVTAIDTARSTARGRRRWALARCRAPARGAVRHDEGVERRPGLRQHVAGLRGQPGQGWGSTRSISTSCTGRSRAWTVTWRRGGRWRSPRRIGVRAIGVSNFQPAHLRRLLDETRTVPAVNQIELHPDLQQEALRQFHAEHGIVTEACPLGQGLALRHPEVLAIARRLDWTPAQVVLRWHLELGNVVIPKSTTVSRIRENIAVFDFALTDADKAALSRLDSGTRLGPDPDERDTRRRRASPARAAGGLPDGRPLRPSACRSPDHARRRAVREPRRSGPDGPEFVLL